MIGYLLRSLVVALSGVGLLTVASAVRRFSESQHAREQLRRWRRLHEQSGEMSWE